MTPARDAYTTTPAAFFADDVKRVVRAVQAAGGGEGVVEFDVGGAGGGAWLVDLKTGDVKPTVPGRAPKVAAIVRAQAGDFVALVEGRMSPQDGVVTGRLSVAGEQVMLGRLWAALAAARAP